ncbi:hypothetical protein [Butyrivibrio fibrisolvens]|uniref:hypothetical protein n=1 Tax=Butyrivibrio fibrisolvens TaxID=831 RepID=UPI00042800DB|nr:hypothetical protein [Butyrivibrio fibrisolvens]
MKFYHITTGEKEIQKVLIPHIPDNTLWEEDIETKRISVCPQIEGCIAGISRDGYMEDVGKILIYEIELDESATDIYPWKMLYEKYNVYDTPLTHEYWINRNIEPSKVYEGIVSNITKSKYILAPPRFKNTIIDGLKKRSLFYREMNEMNVFEISNCCGNDVKEAVKNILTIERESDVDRIIYMRLFGQEPPKERIYNYQEADYITKYDLKLINNNNN